jgi:hypothetical protein
MRFNKPTRIVAAIAVIGAVAAGGAAFTNGSDLPTNVAAYDAASVTGATASDLNYTLDSTGANILDANLTFTTDLTGDTVRIGFDGYSTGALQTCGAPVGGTGAAAGTSTVTCDFGALDNGSGGLGIPTLAEDNVHVAVTGP